MAHSESKTYYIINLQLFAEGGGTDNGVGEAPGVNEVVAEPHEIGVKSPVVKYGIQEEPQNATAETKTEVKEEVPAIDKNAEFENLIKGEYKDLYNQRMQDTIQKRLRNSKEKVEKYDAISPLIESIANKYGVDPNDVNAITKAIDEDSSFLEEEALEKGITVEQLKEFKKMERENAQLKKIASEREAERIYSKWMEDAESTKNIYPSFDFNNEMENPDFVSLIKSNIDVKTAYEVIHKDELITGAMHSTAKAVKEKVTNDIIARGKRPSENGSIGNSATIVKSDVSQLSKQDLDEIYNRALRGEKIRF